MLLKVWNIALYIVLISLQLLVILKLSKLFKGCDTKRLLKHRCLQICVQADIFKYSNLIKTKKIMKTENQKSFYLYFWSNITERGKWMRKFLSFVFVSVLKGTWGIEFSCGTVNCCLIEMSNIPSQHKIRCFLFQLSLSIVSFWGTSLKGFLVSVGYLSHF